MSHSKPPPAQQRRRRWRMGALVLAGLAFVLLAGVQLWAKYSIGLGDPPLFIVDSETEYRYAPNQSVWRYGNRFTINQYSMRSGPVEKIRPPGHRRVVVIGDSIVNGGPRVTDDDVATARLQRSLGRALQQPVVVCNVACGSWGPGNQLGYVKKFGWFDAEVIVIVLNSDDAWDVPGDGSEVGSARMPATKPWCAATEFLSRYLVPIVQSRLFGQSLGERLTTEDKSEPAARQAAESLRQLIEHARASGAVVLVAKYDSLAESAGIYKEGSDRIGRVLLQLDITPIDLGKPFSEAIRAKRGQVFQDLMHPSSLGHQIIAETLHPVVLGHLRARSSR